MTGTDVATYTRDRPGISAFVLEDGVIYHTYSAYSRGVDAIWGTYPWLDRAPKGRNEAAATGGAATTSTTNGKAHAGGCPPARSVMKAATCRPRRSRLAMPRGRADFRNHGAACGWWRPAGHALRGRAVRHR